MKLPDRFIQKISSIVVSLIVFGLCLELGARLDDSLSYGANFFGAYNDDLLYTYDDEGIRHNVPNSRFQKWHNNSFGFRGDDFPRAKNPDTYRIACMGISETYGLYEDPGSEWPARLANILADRQEYHVFNASTVGLATKQYPRYIEKRVIPYDPDLIVILANPQNYFALLERQARQDESADPVASLSPSSRTVQAGLLPELRVLGKARQKIKQFLPQSWVSEYQLWERKRMVAEAESRYLHGKPALDKIPAEYVSDYRAELEALVAGIQAQGIEVVLCSYPTLMSEDNLDEHLSTFLESRRFFVELSFAGMIDASIQCDSITQLVSEKTGAGFIDTGRSIAKTVENFSDNVHFSNQGADSFARLVAAFLDERNPLDRELPETD